MDATRARFAAGDPLRALAALSVFVHHVGLWGLFVSGTAVAAAARPDAYGELGGRMLATLDVGLYVFFALSGYLIARPFVHAFIDGRRAPRLSSYARSRLLRIVPAFWFVAAIAIVRHGSLDSSPSELLAVFSFAQTFHAGGPGVGQAIGQAWTLHVEMGFYMLVPVAAVALTAWAGLRWGRPGRAALVLGLLGAVAAASLALRHALPDTQAALRSVPTVVFAFTPGVALAALESVLPARPRGAGRLRALAFGLIALVLLLAVAYAWRRNDSPAVSGLLAAAAGSALVAAPLVLQWSGAPAWRLLDNRVMHWLGERSYSFYLVHNLVLWEIALALGPVGGAKLGLALLLPLGVAGSVAVSALTYRFVERPFLTLRTRRAPVAAPEPVAAVSRG